MIHDLKFKSIVKNINVKDYKIRVSIKLAKSIPVAYNALK